MTLFCFLWAPLFYLFRRSLADGNANASGIGALLLGSIAALVQFFLGDLIHPGGFGLSRWISGWVDIVVLPALLPILIYLIFVFLGFSSASIEFTNFSLLWLIPSGVLRAVSWSSGNDPVFLVLAPVLWTALVCGIPFFIECVRKFPRWYIVIFSLIGILILPFLAATAWWAFYCQKSFQGFFLSGFTLIPMLASLIIAWLKHPKSEE